MHKIIQRRPRFRLPSLFARLPVTPLIARIVRRLTYYDPAAQGMGTAATRGRGFYPPWEMTLSPEEAATITGWIQQAKAGDERAFEQLARRHERVVKEVAFRQLGSYEDAEDVCQDVMLSVWTHIGDFQGDADSFRHWLLRIATNRCHDVHRKGRTEERREPLVEDEDGETAPTLLPAPTSPRLGWTESFQASDLVNRSMAQLPPSDQKLLDWFDNQQRSYLEISLELGLRPGTVAARVHRAHEKLRGLVLRSDESVGGDLALGDQVTASGTKRRARRRKEVQP